MPRRSHRPTGPPERTDPKVILPSPGAAGRLSLEACLARRRSVREFAPSELSEREVSRLAWSAQGITGPTQGLRTAPSAGALYPLEVYFAGRHGAHRYVPQAHALEPAAPGDLRAALAAAALSQDWIAAAPLVVAVTATYARLRRRYGERAERYAWLEAGHVAQNVHLQAVALGLVSVPVGAFDDARVARVLGLPDGEHPLYLLPIGRPAAPQALSAQRRPGPPADRPDRNVPSAGRSRSRAAPPAAAASRADVRRAGRGNDTPVRLVLG